MYVPPKYPCFCQEYKCSHGTIFGFVELIYSVPVVGHEGLAHIVSTFDESLQGLGGGLACTLVWLNQALCKI